MFFTNNITVILIILFFLIYFVLFELNLKTFQKHSTLRKNYIVLASLFFYATWYPPAIFLLLYHALLGLIGGKKIASSGKKSMLWIIIILALFPLIFFKYYNFFSNIFLQEYSGLSLVLPLGISFYTFSMIGYYIDIYNRRVAVEKSFTEVLLFIAFWPHLAAGPILRAKNIFSNILHAEKLTKNIITLAFILISTGVIKKLLIADNIGAYVNWNVSYGIESMSIFDAWATMLGFGAQIYADFSGYSDMAIGFALLMGFRLPANFNYPYLSSSVTEFWHRWHISLSTWFRDYVYFPLGGSKHSNLHTYLNIFVVFVLSGIWHGAGWSFVIWGGLHGTILIIEKFLGKQYFKIHIFIRWFITILLITIAWSFFRLDFQDAILIVQKMFGFKESLFFSFSTPYYVAVIFFMLLFPILEHVFQFYQVDREGYPKINYNVISIVFLAVFLVLALTFSGSPLPFIYFEF